MMRHSIRSRSMPFFTAIAGAFLVASACHAQGPRHYQTLRNRMVDQEIVAAGVVDELVIDAMRATPRHEFVTSRERENAYYDMALPIGEGQTISPPFVVAYMTEQLEPKPSDRVLEIGTGSGYQAAVLSPLVAEVYSIEIVESLGERAARTLRRLKYENVFTRVGDGYQGWPEHAPFDKIIVTCSPEDVPQALVDQLIEGGRMVIPLGERYQQTLYLFRKENGELVQEALRPTLFVPMTGAAEDERDVLPDPLRPAIVNGDFERIDQEGDLLVPANWHYLRQARVDSEGAFEGDNCVVFANRQPGRGSQALQGFAIDGREIREIDLSCMVRASGVAQGRSRDERAGVIVTYYDERRAMVGSVELGPFAGTFDWRNERERLEVPARAREAIIRIGLFGGRGEIAFDAIELQGIADSE